MLHKLPHVGRKVTPPQPTFMSDEQKSEYLASLRQSRPAGPTGSRPAPFKSHTSVSQHALLRAESAVSLRGPGEDAGHVTFQGRRDYPRSQSSLGHRDSMLSERSMPSLRSTKGRPLVHAPSVGKLSMQGRRVSPTAAVELSSKSEDMMYKESGTRWLERQEAHALRRALEVMDAKEEEKMIHSAAQNEAADLVWQHQNPDRVEREEMAAYRNPDLPKSLKSHLIRGAHERSQSDGNLALRRADPESKQLRTVSEVSASSQPADENIDPIVDKNRSKKKRLSDAMQQLRIASGQAIASVDTRTLRNFSGGRRRMSGLRNASNKSPTFPNPEDKIFEEPEGLSTRGQANDAAQEEFKALTNTTRNSQGARPLPQKAETMPVMPKPRPNPFERRRKQAEQPKAAPYTSSATIPTRYSEPESTPTKDGKEIRSDDIRAATSMKRSDRSPKLPTPTAVSDRAGRPIVSFDPAWKPPSETKSQEQGLPLCVRPEPPAVTLSAPVVPTINLPNDSHPKVPVINLPHHDNPYNPPANLPEISGPGVPTFSFHEPEDHNDTTTITALPTAISPAQPLPPTRPLPQHTQSMPVKSTTVTTPNRLPWLNRGIPTATCTSCTLPISGRIVTASDASQRQKARFHPECFTCAHCSTPLECVAFYPEPEAQRFERHEREQMTAENDALRFYCHLDFHEFFSPRCRSCKTPIEGEVILAAGGEYHVGHFFCAECGDPFESTTPFVEKSGYAYCVSCHRKRTSERCKGCKALILDEGSVEALGGQWHENCFKCFECDGVFGDDGRFYLREVQVEVTAKERRRGMDTKFEEKPVCQACEELRLKQ